jgi:tetratricopeptide (TPR) repeat protein
VRDLVVARVHRLGDQTRRVVALVATAGRACPFGLLREAAGLEEGTLLDSLDEALEARVLEERGADYAFHHPLIRESVYAALSQQRRAHYHRAVAEALERQQPEEVEQLAHHHVLGGNTDQAVLYLERAGDRARAVYANQAAERCFRDLLARLGAEARPLDRARALLKLAAVLSTVARYDEALEPLEEGLGLYRAQGDPAGMGEATAEIALAHSHKGDPPAGIERIRAVLTTLEAAGPSLSLGKVYLALVSCLFSCGRFEESLEPAERAVEIAGAVGDDRLVADAAARRGTSLAGVGRWEEGAAELRRAAPLAERLGDADLLARLMNNLSVAATIAGDYLAARDYCQRSVELAEKMGDPATIAYQLAALGNVQMLLGDWTGARASLERALQLSRHTGRTFASAHPPITLGCLNVLEGRWDEAAELLHEGLALAQESDDVQFVAWATAWLARLDICRGQPAAARDRVAAFLAGPPAGYQTAWLRYILAYAYLELGEYGLGERTADEAVERTTADGIGLEMADALWVKGMVTGRLGRWEEAQQAFDGALRSCGDTDPYRKALILAARGEMQARQGRTEEARAGLEWALATFRRLGARPDADRAERAVRALPSAVG